MSTEHHLYEDVKRLIELMGFGDFSVNYDEEKKRFSIFVDKRDIADKFLPNFVDSLDCILRLIATHRGVFESIFVDINNYRRERENLIIELARAAARKVVAQQKEIPLPAMNAYERRLIHLELASRPDIKTESEGFGKSRYVNNTNLY